MNWRQFVKDNQAMLLSLPGAVLWSIPVGFLGWRWIGRFMPTVPFDEWRMFNFALIAGLVLAPTATVCSTMAILRFVDNREGYHRVAAGLLIAFNCLSATVAGTLTLVVIMRVLEWLVRALFFR
jgi:hypothetical protein